MTKERALEILDVATKEEILYVVTRRIEDHTQLNDTDRELLTALGWDDYTLGLGMHKLLS